MITSPYYDFFILEKKKGLFELKFQNINYWQLVRMQLLKGITIKKLYVVNNFQNRSIKKEILDTFFQSIKMKRCINGLKRVDLIRIRPCVSLTKNDQLDDHQYDYFNLNPDISTTDLYALGNYVSMPNVAKNNMSIAEFKVILWKIKRKILGDKGLEVSQKLLLQEFFEEINKIYDTTFTFEQLESDIQYAVATHKIYKKEYLKIFSQTKPKAIMVYPHYDEHMFAAVAVAKMQGISSIEMQHGRINSHEAYWYEE